MTRLTVALAVVLGATAALIVAAVTHMGVRDAGIEGVEG